MIVVIDAYNVLKQIKQGYVSTAEQHAFINRLRMYARSKRVMVVVVFDGGGTPWPVVEKDPEVTVVYAGEQLSADDYIRRYLKEHRNKELLLITDDRELKKNAQVLDIDTFGSLAFYARLLQKDAGAAVASAQQTIVIKTSADAPAELDALMENSDVRPKKEEPCSVASRKPTGFTPSKKERKINRKIKKL